VLLVIKPGEEVLSRPKERGTLLNRDKCRHKLKKEEHLKYDDEDEEEEEEDDDDEDEGEDEDSCDDAICNTISDISLHVSTKAANSQCTR
jgi:hypothetical protein